MTESVALLTEEISSHGGIRSDRDRLLAIRAERAECRHSTDIISSGRCCDHPRGTSSTTPRLRLVKFLILLNDGIHAGVASFVCTLFEYILEGSNWINLATTPIDLNIWVQFILFCFGQS